MLLWLLLAPHRGSLTGPRHSWAWVELGPSPCQEASTALRISVCLMCTSVPLSPFTCSITDRTEGLSAAWRIPEHYCPWLGVHMEPSCRSAQKAGQLCVSKGQSADPDTGFLATWSQASHWCSCSGWGGRLTVLCWNALAEILA